MARDVVGCIGCKEDDRPGKFMRLTPPSGGRPVGDKGVPLEIFEQRSRQFGLEIGGASAFTCTLCGAHSSASTFVSCSTPPFELA